MCVLTFQTCRSWHCRCDPERTACPPCGSRGRHLRRCLGSCRSTRCSCACCWQKGNPRFQFHRVHPGCSPCSAQRSCSGWFPTSGCWRVQWRSTQSQGWRPEDDQKLDLTLKKKNQPIFWSDCFVMCSNKIEHWHSPIKHLLIYTSRSHRVRLSYWETCFWPNGLTLVYPELMREKYVDIDLLLGLYFIPTN